MIVSRLACLSSRFRKAHVEVYLHVAHNEVLQYSEGHPIVLANDEEFSLTPDAIREGENQRF